MTADLHERLGEEARDARARDAVRELLPVLQRLDARLEHAAACVPSVYGDGTANDRYRGLYVSDDDVQRALGRSPGEPLFGDDDGEPEIPVGSRLEWLAEAFDLEPFDIDVVMLALAPELDVRYERLYAYLQDDVTRRRPTVDLALNLFCDSAADRVARRSRFALDAPLLSSRVIELVPDPGARGLLNQIIVVDPQILGYMLGDSELDPRVASCGSLIAVDSAVGELTAGSELTHALTAIIERAYDNNTPLALHFLGPRGSGKRAAAATAATRLGRSLLALDVSRLLDAADWERTLALARREAWLRGALLYFHGCDALLSPDKESRRADLEAVAATYGGTIILSTTRAWPGALGGSIVLVEFGIPPFERQAQLWREMTAQCGASLSTRDATALASRFQLTPRQIAVAVESAAARLRWRHASSMSHDARLTVGDLFASARQGSGLDLATLASRIEPVHGWDELVLPDDTIAQLREICERVALRHEVLGRWGFGRRFSRGKGVNALFSGSSGTGKTMAAEVIAKELGLDLFRVELAGVVSKYIGETEKNLDRIFAAAERSNGIILFDEADALFGKRSEVHDAHDRYANIEISYLLQRMEEYDGIAILSTNLRGNLDAAFVRRLAFTVHFPFPEEASRARIWRSIWPAEIPLGDDLDFELLAARFAVSGGNIRNIALSAAFLAARDGGRVTMRHVVAATRREYQKLGKTIDTADLNGGAAVKA